jgi:hypothetical protein
VFVFTLSRMKDSGMMESEYLLILSSKSSVLLLATTKLTCETKYRIKIK